jgi:hypothetical protein
MSKNILTMDDLRMFGWKLNASFAISSIAGLFSADFCTKNNLVEPKNILVPFGLVFAMTNGYLLHRIIKQVNINSEKYIIEKEIQKIDTIANNNNDAVEYVNANHFLSAFPNSEEEIVNPVCFLAHSYILGKKNNMLKIVVIPNANKTQNEEEVKRSRPNALLQLLEQKRAEIDTICARDGSFLNFLKPQENKQIYIFYQEDNKNGKSIKP